MIKGKERSPIDIMSKNKNVHFSFYFEKCTFIYIKLEDLPGCAGLREAWEVILLAKSA